MTATSDVRGDYSPGKREQPTNEPARLVLAVSESMVTDLVNVAARVKGSQLPMVNVAGRAKEAVRRSWRAAIEQAFDTPCRYSEIT